MRYCFAVPFRGSIRPDSYDVGSPSPILSFAVRNERLCSRPFVSLHCPYSSVVRYTAESSSVSRSSKGLSTLTSRYAAIISEEQLWPAGDRSAKFGSRWTVSLCRSEKELFCTQTDGIPPTEERRGASFCAKTASDNRLRGIETVITSISNL
jgi:hypothetical protein